MKRLIVGSCAILVCAWTVVVSAPHAVAASRAMPMTFEMQLEGPAESCAPTCRSWVSAQGAITSDTPNKFEAFAEKNNVRGAMIVLDSDGGSVLGALAFGRLVRAFEMVTTVGRTEVLETDVSGLKRARFNPQTTCESMCGFVLLAGVERHVPPQARVKVHQIWLGDRREDPIAANYSAQDLVLVQRDIGRLAQYTIEMGATIDILEMALRIPPWEPMRELTRAELRTMGIVTGGMEVADATPTAALVSQVISSGPRSAIGRLNWEIAQRPDGAVLTRRHPLTVEGNTIGSFELHLSCGVAGGDYALTYVEQRHWSKGGSASRPVEVGIVLSGEKVLLQVMASETAGEPGRGVDTVARGTIPADLIRNFVDVRSRSLTVETMSEDTETEIRVGNAGIARSFSKFAAGCSGTPMVRHSELRREAVAQPPR